MDAGCYIHHYRLSNLHYLAIQHPVPSSMYNFFPCPPTSTPPSIQPSDTPSFFPTHPHSHPPPSSTIFSLRPSSHQTHQKGPKEHKQASIHPALALEHLPTLITQKVLRHEFHKRGEDEETSRDSVHDTDDEETDFRVGRVQSVCRYTDCHAAGCAGLGVSRVKSDVRLKENLRATIRESHKPRLCSAWIPFDVGDTYTESKAFEGFYQGQYTDTFS